MSRRSVGQSTPREDVVWHDWTDPVRGHLPGVQWGGIFSEEEAPGMGLFEIAPGEELPEHHHQPLEVYFVISGVGKVRIYNKDHELAPETTVYIPSNASHTTINTGEKPLRILYSFPNASFRDVDYHFDD